MTLTTDKGLTADVAWAWSPTSDGKMMAQFPRVIPIGELDVLCGCAHMHTSDPHEGERDHDGYTMIVGYQADTAKQTTTITWAKGGDTD